MVQLAHAHVELAAGDVESANRYAAFAERGLRDAGDARQAEALRVLGDTYRKTRTEDGLPAIDAYREAVEIDRDDVLSRSGIARTYIDRLDFDEAGEWIDRARAVHRSHPEVEATRAELWLYQRRFSEALEKIDTPEAQEELERWKQKGNS